MTRAVMALNGSVASGNDWAVKMWNLLNYISVGYSISDCIVRYTDVFFTICCMAFDEINDNLFDCCKTGYNWFVIDFKLGVSNHFSIFHKNTTVLLDFALRISKKLGLTLKNWLKKQTFN